MGVKKEMSIFDILNVISKSSNRLFVLKENVKGTQPAAAQRLIDANEHLCQAYNQIELYLEELK